ncbi:hypothetical protein VPHF86_0209 [Vibrio phage F86]
MTILELFQKKARMLLEDEGFLSSMNQYTCHEMRDYAIDHASVSDYLSIYDEVQALGDGFRKLLLTAPVSTVGFELSTSTIEILESDGCTAFVHALTYGGDDECMTETEAMRRFVTGRKAWLNYIINAEA